MKYYYCTNVYDGKVYDIYCEKFPDGRYNLQTKEARFVGLVSEVPYAKYIKWKEKTMREYLRDLRKERGLSQDEISKRMGLTQSFYSMIETGERIERMNLDTAVKIANAMGIEQGKFIERELEWERERLKEGE